MICPDVSGLCIEGWSCANTLLSLLMLLINLLKQMDPFAISGLVLDESAVDALLSLALMEDVALC